MLILTRVVTYACDFIKVTYRINPQYLNRNLAISVFTLPHIGISATVQWSIRLIVTKWDLQ
jgi:hypothetical protein